MIIHYLKIPTYILFKWSKANPFTLLFLYDNLAILLYHTDMNNRHEFELITNKTSNFKAFINVLSYRTPHIHLDYEIGLILGGELSVIVENGEHHFKQGDIMCFNPCQIHEFKSEEQATLLLIQVNPSYFNNIFPLIQSIEFTSIHSPKDEENLLYIKVRNNLIDFAEMYMKKEPLFELRCAGTLNILFSDILSLIPYQETSADSLLSARNKASRIRMIADYIENNYMEKIKLSDLAGLLNITETHMSHVFSDNFHMTFQEYLMRLRCEKARSLLLMTDLSLFDISYSCGFSDPKYLNQGFLRQFNCLPKEYRKRFGHQKLENQQKSMLTTQQILSDKTSLIILEKYTVVK